MADNWQIVNGVHVVVRSDGILVGITAHDEEGNKHKAKWPQCPFCDKERLSAFRNDGSYFD